LAKSSAGEHYIVRCKEKKKHLVLIGEMNASGALLKDATDDALVIAGESSFQTREAQFSIHLGNFVAILAVAL